MNQFQRLLVSLGCATMLGGFPAPASAVIWLKITDGAGTNHPTPIIPGITVEELTSHGVTTTMPFFTCTNTTRPCSATLTNNTFEFRDACGVAPLPSCPTTTAPDSGGVARIIKYEDASIQWIALKGLQIIDRLEGERRVTVSFGTGPDDFTPVPAGSYPWAVTLGGTFTRRPVQQAPAGGGGLTPSCPSPYAMPSPSGVCARLQLRINGADVDTSRPVPLRTVSIPCKNTPGSPAPCGGGNSYRTNGSFTSSLSGAAWLTEETSVQQEMNLADVRFTAPDQTFAPLNSAVMTMSRRTEEEFGVENLFYSMADELGGDYWVSFSAGSDSYFPSMAGVTLTSIVTKKWPSPIQQMRNKRSYASFIAEPLALQWKDVTRLVLAYDYVVGAFEDLTYSDCANGSFRLLVALVDENSKEVAQLPIYLGSGDDFRSGCAKAAGELNDVNLVKHKKVKGETRVAGGMTIEGSQQKYGRAYVRSISVVVDQGSDKPVANYMVELYDVKVNGVRLAGMHAARDAFAQFAALPRNIEAGKPGRLRVEPPTNPIHTVYSR